MIRMRGKLVHSVALTVNASGIGGPILMCNISLIYSHKHGCIYIYI